MNNLRSGFTLIAVGDVLSSRPIANLAASDPEFRAVVDRVRSATIAYGNLEMSILDIAAFRGTIRTAEDWLLTAPPPVARDLAKLGFGVMSRANNHSMDWGVDGLRTTTDHINSAGIVHAGVGETLSRARSARYVDTHLGRVGIVSVYTCPFWNPDSALDQYGEIPSRPGVSTIRLQTIVGLPPDRLQTLYEIKRALCPDQLIPDGPLRLFDTTFVEGANVAVRYEPDNADVTEVLKSIRLARQHADIVMVAIHSHEEGASADTVPRFLQQFAQSSISAGADAIIGHGVHRLCPIEVYRGRPILYGLGNFVFSGILEPQHASFYEAARPLLEAAGIPWSCATAADVNSVLDSRDFGGERFFQSVMAELRYEVGQLTIRLHPITLGYGRPITSSGIPRIPNAQESLLIIEHLRQVSMQYGTAIELESGVGTIRLDSTSCGAL